MDRSERFEPLGALADQGRWEDAYVWFREHQDRFSRREQRLIRAALSRRLWRAPVLLAGWSVWSLIPYAQDLPLVMAGEWRTGIVTEEQENAMARNNVLVGMGREPEGEYDPIPWYTSPRWPKTLMPIMPGLYNRWVCDIHVDDVTCRMGRMQFDLTDYEVNVYPVRIDYLPHSRLVLWISCGEG